MTFVPKPVTDPKFWKQRLAEAPDLRRALWIENDDHWDRMEREHRDILAREIKPTDSILDAGCGAGRLLDLLPDHWFPVTVHRHRAPHFFYRGVDISPDLIATAKKQRKGWQFDVGDLTNLSEMFPWDKCFDVAVCVMLRHMLIGHAGVEYWQKVEAELRRVAKRLLILEPGECSD